MITGRALGWRDHLFGLAITIAYVALLLATSRDLGMGRDEGFYVDAAERYAGWFELLGEDRAAALDQENIDRFWTVNHEHPSLPKSLFALSWLAHRTWDVFPLDSMAFRFPGMLMSALLLWLIYAFGARAYGRPVGVFAAIAWALMPNVFYHSHLDAFDVPVVTMLTLVTYCYWRSLAEPRWAIATGLAYGLALETKHNAWILPLVFLVHWVFFVLPGERAARRAGKGAVTTYVPWWLIAMGALGPVLFVALWPWLWADTAARFSEYASFHLNHVHYNIAYLGRTYFGPPGPMSYPFVTTLFTVPLATLLLALAGIGLRARALVPPWIVDRVWPHGRPLADRQRTDVLAFGSMITPMIVIALPSSPIFGGTKHFIAGWVFLAIFAGIAFVHVARALGGVIERALRGRGASPRLAYAAAAAVLLAPSAIDTVHSHPFGLSFYNFSAGGVPGAADLGMMRQFWGFTTGSLTPWLNEHVPERGSVWICDTVPTAWRMLQRDGQLRDDIRASWDLASADYAIVHHEDHFVEVDYQIWVAFGRVDPVYVLTYDGVPIISVYENPHRRAR
ncbi:MAG: glycosyltransferase family 39 protein [Myxococcota bacterium]|nr:glycosyltransferase family 39 protein [Myxococcota bacterium]